MRSAHHYRAEIDGLRAVAVLPVMLFHADFGVIPGGFLGVDVFFVISGYLITRILDSAWQSGSFSLLEFYERRARRILPALVAMLVVTFPLAMLLMPPLALHDYFRSLWAAASFWSNFHFWSANDYFSPAADEQPLLHTWSLAVEEQFYMVFPLVCMFALRIGRKHLAWVFAGLSTTGFGLCLWQSTFDSNSAFFLIHSRMWELLAGAALALAVVPAVNLRAGAIALAGLLAIISAMVVFHPAWLNPGWSNLVVVVGTLCVLAFAAPWNLVGKVLGSRVTVAVGLISYSAYLWHQPLLAFARHYSFGEPSQVFMATMLVLAMVLAAISWKYVEQPFRQRDRFSRHQVFAYGTVAIVALSAMGVVPRLLELQTWRVDPAQAALVSPHLSKLENCEWQTPLGDLPAFKLCRMGAANKTGIGVLLWGDSHAAALHEELGATLSSGGGHGMFMRSHRCWRIPGVFTTAQRAPENVAGCDHYIQQVYDYLRKNPPEAIVLHLRWTFQLFPVPGAMDQVNFDNGEGGVETESHREFWARDKDGQWTQSEEAKFAALLDMAQQLSAIAPLIIVGPVPEAGWQVGQENFKSLVVHGGAPRDLSTSHARFAARNLTIQNMLAKLAGVVRFKRIDPVTLLCNTLVVGRCIVQHAGIPYYADDDHVSSAGARLLVDKIAAALQP